jgi:DNA-binding HxlR family transcriptional regulator
VLIGALKELEADAIILREDFKQIPPHVEYSLTPFGVTLAEALRPVCEWGYEHMDARGVITRRRQQH